jgi:hypothetical protein
LTNEGQVYGRKRLPVNCVRDANMLAVPAVCALCLLGSLCRRIDIVVGLGGGAYNVKAICVIVFMAPLFVYQLVLYMYTMKNIW